MLGIAIGFDTSCYTTSVAAVDASGDVLASLRMLLPVQSGQRGLRQSEAVFVHVRQMPMLVASLQEALAKGPVCAVGASAGPRANADSYMPVFTVGLGHAQVLAGVMGVPCYSFSHQQGHIAAGQIGGAAMGERFVALHLSGGTTELLVSERATLTLLGGTLDLHAGQLIDRVGVALGLGFPAGPALEQLALTALEPPRALLPANLTHDDLDCHLSGAETRCMDWVAQGLMTPQAIAAELFDFLARTVARMLQAACLHTKADRVLVVGGVASSTLLRTQLRNRLQKLNFPGTVHFGKPEYSGDNAAGIARLAMQRYQQGNAARV